MVRLVAKARRVLKACKVRRVLLAQRARQDRRELLDLRVLRDQREVLDQQVRRAQQASQEALVFKVLPDHKGQPVCKVQWVPWGQLEFQAQPVALVSRVRQGQREWLGLLDRQVRPDQVGRPERPVSAKR